MVEYAIFPKNSISAASGCSLDIPDEHGALNEKSPLVLLGRKSQESISITICSCVREDSDEDIRSAPIRFPKRESTGGPCRASGQFHANCRLRETPCRHVADLQWFAGCLPTRDEGVPAMTFLRSAPCCKSRPKIARYILTDLRSTGVLDQQA